MSIDNFEAKLVVVGESGCGKSSIIYRLITGNFNPSQDATVGASFYCYSTVIDRKPLRLAIWDTAGQERYDSISTLYARNSNAVIIVCDPTLAKPIDSIIKWHNKIVKQVLDEDVFVYIGINKIDLVEQNMNFDDIENYGESINAPVFKISAKDGTNIKEMFDSASRKIVCAKLKSFKSSFVLSASKHSKEVIKKKKKTCC
jgi:small GTP-binding protein